MAKKKINSINKGKNFEREAVHILERTLGGKWQRVPGSGAMATAQNIEDPRFKGDIFTEDPKYQKVVIEAKITKHPITLEDLVNKKSIVGAWMDQTLSESGAGRLSVLIFKYKYSGVYAAVFNGPCYVDLIDLRMELINAFMGTGVRQTINNGSWLIIPLEE